MLLLCPNNSWIYLKSVLASRRYVAQLCLKECEVTIILIPAFSIACFKTLDRLLTLFGLNLVWLLILYLLGLLVLLYIVTSMKSRSYFRWATLIQIFVFNYVKSYSFAFPIYSIRSGRYFWLMGIWCFPMAISSVEMLSIRCRLTM